MIGILKRNYDMIPKQLFFIWIGNDIPNFVNYSISNFKKVNPDFQVDLIYDNIEDPQTDHIKQLLYIYENDCRCGNQVYLDIFKKEITTFTGSFYENRINKIVTICNILRVYLIYKYGGMYLDCDTFPVKPFDDELLKEPFQSYHDNFWFGGNAGDIIINNDSSFQNRSIGKYIKTFYEENILQDINYRSYRQYEMTQRFIDCDINYGEKVLDNYNGWDYYIDHYIQGSWWKESGREYKIRD